MDRDDAAQAFGELVAVIQALRTPGTGCPWDLEQDHRTLRPYLIEEAYEVLDAIDRADDPALREELGDLLLQVVLHAQVADDRGAFAIAAVVRGITEKMVRRHPHVFGSTRVRDTAEVVRNWEAIKAAEKRTAGDAPAPADAFDRVPARLPALRRAQRLIAKAGPAGAGSIAALRSAFAALEAQAAAPAEHARLEHMLGEVLFGVCQLARRLGLSAEDILRAANQRFVEQMRRAAAETQEPSP